MVHSAMVASIRQSDCIENAGRRRPPDCDPGARATIAHPLYDRNPHDLISPDTAEKERMAEWPRGRRNSLEMLDSRKGRSLDFASPGLDFPSPRLGFSFPKAWIFLPPAWIFLPPLRAAGELS